MKDVIVLQEISEIWKVRKGVAVGARGASGSLSTLWNHAFFQLERSFKSMHWVMARLLHLPTGNLIHLNNVYMSNKYREK
jgi:hypothetical protein